MNIDKNTGLPELPTSQYWQVTQDHLGLDQPTWLIRIMQEAKPEHWSDWHNDPWPMLRVASLKTEKRETAYGRTWYGKKKTRHEFRELIKPEPRIVWSRTINFRTPHPGPEHIKHAAFAALDDLEQYQDSRKLIGCYPPNKLEDK